ncbi:endo alpha-1,4 polygalactosaminidase [Streptomyces sp. NPDC102490]|uniref:endo alpha-1,4 polygalactosaminidase n=1 Tax=Streptomyces sp. NPDC102490 TaxID=3366183 RepID=UPI00382EBEF9
MKDPRRHASDPDVIGQTAGLVNFLRDMVHSSHQRQRDDRSREHLWLAKLPAPVSRPAPRSDGLLLKLDHVPQCAPPDLPDSLDGWVEPARCLDPDGGDPPLAEEGPGTELVRAASGNIVYDGEWKEAILDTRTADKRQRIAAKVGTWIDQCGDKGFQAIEPDNFDSFTRSKNLLDEADAQAYIKLLSTRAHADGMAIGQKNTVELSGNRVENGLDFAVAEECGEWEECGDYTADFGNNVIVIEYTAEGLRDACAQFADTLSIVQRDMDVSPKGSSTYVRETC